MKGYRLCHEVATGVGGDAGQLGSFQGRDLQDAPAAVSVPFVSRSMEQRKGAENVGGTDLPKSTKGGIVTVICQVHWGSPVMAHFYC